MFGLTSNFYKFHLSQKEKVNKLCYYLPYNFFIGKHSEGIVLLKPGALSRTYAFRCPDLGAASAEEMNAISVYFNQTIKKLGNNWAVHFESRRQLTQDYPGTEWTSRLGYLIDARRKDIFKNIISHFYNYNFFTITYNVKNDYVSKSNSILYKKSETSDADYYNMQNIRNELDFFRSRTNDIISTLSSRLPSITPLNDDEYVSYICSCLSTHWKTRKAPVTPTFFDSFLTEEDVETGNCMKVGEYYCPIVSIRDFPSETYPAMFDMLNRTDISYRWVTRWIGIDKQAAKDLALKYQKHFNNSRKSWGQVFAETAGGVDTDRYDPTSVAFETDVNNAMVSLGNDEVSFGYYTSCIEVWDRDYDMAIRKANYIVEQVNSSGFNAKIEETNSFQAWLGMLPGNTYSNVRKTLITSGNCSQIIPLSNIWNGDKYNRWTDEHIGCGSPLLTATSFNNPFFLNLNIGDLFHTFIFGPSGAGKSTFLCLLESQFLKYKDAKVIVLDKGKTSRGVCMAAGGVYVEPGADDFAFQPLRDLETEKDLTWACNFITLCLSEQGLFVNSTKSEHIREALVQLRDTKAPEKRDITGFQQYVQDSEIKDGIEPYTIDGQFGSIFDSRNATYFDSDFTMIEMGYLMSLGEKCVTPALMYIFKYIESQFASENDSNGHPTLLVLDEAWAFLDNDFFREQIDDWLRTLRKRRVACVFATQDVPSVAKSPIASTILINCQTRFFLADPNAASEMLAENYAQFGLTKTEILTLSQAIQKKHYFYKSPLGARLFELNLDRFQLSLLCPSSGLLDALEENYGRNSGIELADVILDAQGINPEKYFQE